MDVELPRDAHKRAHVRGADVGVGTMSEGLGGRGLFDAHSSFLSDHGETAAALLRVKMSDLRGRMEELRSSNEDFLRDIRKDTRAQTSSTPVASPPQVPTAPASAPAPPPAVLATAIPVPSSKKMLLDRHVMASYDCDRLRSLLKRASASGGETFAFAVLVPTMRFLQLASCRYLTDVSDTPEQRTEALAAIVCALESNDLAEVRAALGNPELDVVRLVGLREVFSLCLSGRTRDPGGAYAKSLLAALQSLLRCALASGVDVGTRADARLDACLVASRVRHVGPECFHAPSSIVNLAESCTATVIRSSDGALTASLVPAPL